MVCSFVIFEIALAYDEFVHWFASFDMRFIEKKLIT